VRDLILLIALICTLPLIVRAPIVGLLAWIWITLMSPQREVYGFLRGFELNFYVAVLTAGAWLASKERKIVPLNPLSLLLIAFVAWSSLSTYVAIDRAYSSLIWDRTLKTAVLGLAVATLANTRARVQAVVWSMTIALGYYAVKGGGFVLLTGGRQHVYGPENTMIADNNSLGLALIVLLPLMNYLRVSTQRRLTQWVCLGVMACTVIAIIGTYSRGALLAMGAAAATYAVRSKSGVVVVILGAIMMVTLPTVLPSTWLDRMSTIKSYDQDASFEGRVAAWKTSFNIAKARPLTGGGFSSVDLDQVARAYPSPGSLQKGRAAHSIYFEVLGDTGFVGLGLYFSILVAAWYNTGLILSAARGRRDLAWAGELGRMLQVSLVALIVGGAALSMAYYDGFIVVLMLTVAVLQAVRNPVRQAEVSTEPRWRLAASQTASPASI
jgi:putative inorganic carbon (HCO3(-)) transporter